MKWKVQIRGENPSDSSIKLLTERTSLSLDEILMAFSSQEGFVYGGLSETEAQFIADGLRRDTGIDCRVLPDSGVEEKPLQLFRVLLVNYRPGYRTRLRRRLQELTRLPQEQIIMWLSRMPFALSKGVDAETARRVKKSLDEAGGIVRIESDTPLTEATAARKRSTAVFRRTTEPEPSLESDISDILFKKTPEDDRGDSAEPPVMELPEGYLSHPPPLDRIATSSGVVVMHSPPVFVFHPPSVMLHEFYYWMPPVLPDRGEDSLPPMLQFTDPPHPCEEEPPVVGSRAHSEWADEPSPEVVYLFPPPSSFRSEQLLPPVLESTHEGEVQPVLTNQFAIDWESVDEGSSVLEETGGTMKLYLCRPAPEDEDMVAEALREIMGVSLRESWDLLRKAPTLIREYSDHVLAILTVHRLESKGVSVTLTRRMSGRARATEHGGGLRAWLTSNG